MDTIKKRKELYRFIKNKYMIGDKIENEDHFNFYLNQYNNFYSVSNGEVKISGDKIEWFEIGYDKYGNTNIQVKYVDMVDLKEVGMKYMCGECRNDFGGICKVFRLVIQDQIDSFGSKSKEDLTDMNIDHLYPFSFMVEDFMDENKLTVEMLKVSNNKIVKGKKIMKMFYEYHNNYCLLRLMDGVENKRRGNRITDMEKQDIRRMIKGFKFEIRKTILKRFNIKLIKRVKRVVVKKKI